MDTERFVVLQPFASRFPFETWIDRKLQTKDVAGGVISSVIDATGGVAAFIGIQEKMQGKTLEATLQRSSRISTIDLRVDFLRPGLGKRCWGDQS